MEAVTAEEETAGVGAMPAAAIRAVRMPAPVPMLEPARTQAQAPRLLMPVLPLMRVLRPAVLAGPSRPGPPGPNARSSEPSTRARPLAERAAGAAAAGRGGVASAAG